MPKPLYSDGAAAMETKVDPPLQRPKPISSTQLPSPTKASRVALLLLLSLIAASTLLSLPPSPTHELHPSDLPCVEEIANNDVESIMSHLLSTGRDHLKVQEDHTIPRSSLDLHQCQALIDGKVNETATGNSKVGILCCDRSHRRTDVCYMRGDVRTNATTRAILLYDSNGERQPAAEKIRPYTRKWETPIMSTIDELTLVPMRTSGEAGRRRRRCDVRHNVPGVVMSSGGYTGNVYHEFNDGMLPLFLTAERFRGEVVVVVVEYHRWWFDKYEAVLRRLTNYELVDFRRDKRVHCFPEMVVGLRIHGELSIDPGIMPTGKGIRDFQVVLNQALGGGSVQRYSTEALTTNQLEPSIAPPDHRRRTTRKPTIAIFVRHGSRALSNLRNVVRQCRRLGFRVRTINPKRNTPLSHIYATLHRADVMLAVHGAAVTHFLFMRPGSVLVQVVPLGLDWAADEYYGQPARRLGLAYLEYKVSPEESSLSREYKRDDPVIGNPTAITQKGWQETKRIYLQHQNVTLDLKRFGKVLIKAHSRVRQQMRANYVRKQPKEKKLETNINSLL